MIPKILAWPPSVWPQPICRHRNVEQMADKRRFVHRNRGLFNSNTRPIHNNKKLQELYFEAARHWRAKQKMYKRIGDNPTHYCSMWATSTYRVCGLAKIIHQKLAEAAKLIDDKSPYYKYTPANVLENENFKLYWNRSILTNKTISLFDLTQLSWIRKQRTTFW